MICKRRHFDARGRALPVALAVLLSATSVAVGEQHTVEDGDEDVCRCYIHKRTDAEFRGRFVTIEGTSVWADVPNSNASVIANVNMSVPAGSRVITGADSSTTLAFGYPNDEPCYLPIPPLHDVIIQPTDGYYCVRVIASAHQPPPAQTVVNNFQPGVLIIPAVIIPALVIATQGGGDGKSP